MSQRFSGDKLRKLRQSFGISRERLGLEIGRSYLSICHYESGKTTPPTDVAQRIADVLGIPLEALQIEVPSDA